ncbi:MAG: CHASE3 domain-containing protein [Aliidongia sp.]
MRRVERIAGGSIVAATVAIVLGSLTLVVWTQTGLREELVSIRHTHDVVDALVGVEEALRDGEDGARAYALTGDRRDLEHYQSELPVIGSRLSALRDLIAAQPPELDRFRNVSALIGQETDRLARVTSYLEAGAHDRAVALLVRGDDPPLFDTIEIALHGMRDAERADLHERRVRANGISTWLVRGSIVVGAVLLAILAIGCLLAYSMLRRRRAAETGLRDSERLIGSIFDHAQVGIG